MSVSTICLIDLIDDVLLAIFNCLSTRDVLTMRCVCKCIYALLKSQNILKRRFKTDLLEGLLGDWGLDLYTPEAGDRRITKLTLDKNVVRVISEGWPRSFIVERRFINFNQMVQNMRPCRFGPPEMELISNHNSKTYSNWESNTESDLESDTESDLESDNISDSELNALSEDKTTCVWDHTTDWYLQLRNDILVAQEDIEVLSKFPRECAFEASPGIMFDCRIKASAQDDFSRN